MTDQPISQRKQTELAPAFFFLASSLNVELVYMILKGVKSFAYLNCNEFSCPKAVEKMQSIEAESDALDRDVTITLRKIKIKNVNAWSDERIETESSKPLSTALNDEEEAIFLDEEEVPKRKQASSSINKQDIVL